MPKNLQGRYKEISSKNPLPLYFGMATAILGWIFGITFPLCEERNISFIQALPLGLAATIIGFVILALYWAITSTLINHESCFLKLIGYGIALPGVPYALMFSILSILFFLPGAAIGIVFKWIIDLFGRATGRIVPMDNTSRNVKEMQTANEFPSGERNTASVIDSPAAGSGERPGDTQISGLKLIESGIVYERRNDLDQALAAYKRAANRVEDKNAPLAVYRMILLYGERMNNIEHALKLCEKFLSIFPDHSIGNDVRTWMENHRKS